MSTQPLMEDVLGFVEKAGRALHESRQLAETLVVEQEKVAHLVSADVEAMAGTKLLDGSTLIDATEKQAATSKLATHQGSLEVLNNALEIFGEQLKKAHQTIALLQQGTPETGTQKQASAPASSVVIGARHGDGDQPESWRKMAESLGVR